MKFIVDARRKHCLPFKEHSCSLSACDPLNELGLMSRGILPRGPPTVADNLYVCKYGQTHQCLPEKCMALEVCPISGASYGIVQEYGYYDPDDSRTWSKPGAPAPGTSVIDEGVSKAERRVETLVETILYSKHRERVRNDWNNNQRKRAKKEKDAYCAECDKRRVPINLIRLISIELSCEATSGNLHILKRDTAVIARYTGYVMQVYRNVQRYAQLENVSPEAVALGVLYRMQQGMVVNEVPIIPLDRFLVNNLPLTNDLPKFNIDKKQYTVGENLIFAMLEAARKQGKTDQELAIHEDMKNEEIYYKLGTESRSP